MHQTQTLSLYFFNDPRNYMLVKLDTIKPRPIEHQRTTLLKQPLCCLADKSFAPVVHSLQSHERKFRMFKRLFIYNIFFHLYYSLSFELNNVLPDDDILSLRQVLTALLFTMQGFYRCMRKHHHIYRCSNVRPDKLSHSAH